MLKMLEFLWICEFSCYILSRVHVERLRRNLGLGGKGGEVVTL
jgi:hypothetical protein